MTVIKSVFVFFIISGVHEALSIQCHVCLSFEKYDTNCEKLRGRGKHNVDGYHQDCSVLMNACSLYRGKFVHENGRPRNIVWRQCDTLRHGEEECHSSLGPDVRIPTTGQMCKCQQDFCNWQEGVDDPNYPRTIVEAPDGNTTWAPFTSNADAAATNPILLLAVAAASCRKTCLIKSLQT